MIKLKEIKNTNIPEFVLEACYDGNMGAMEMFKFYQIATESEIKKLESLMENDKIKEAWSFVQKVTGMKLMGKEFGS